MGLTAKVMVWVATGLASGCSPTFDWREARPADGLVAMFPCRPQAAVRQVMLAGQRVDMSLLSCATGGSAFAVSRIEVEDPGRIEALLDSMRSALLMNLSPPAPSASASVGAVAPAAASTSTDGRLGGQHLEVVGSGPEGQPMRAEGEFFSHRGSIYQATVVGRAPDREASDFFFASLQVRLCPFEAAVWRRRHSCIAAPAFACHCSG